MSLTQEHFFEILAQLPKLQDYEEAFNLHVKEHPELDKATIDAMAHETALAITIERNIKISPE